MSYASEVLADSPWGFWETDEASGTLADSSGNSRSMSSFPNGGPTYAQTGPDGSTANALLWAAGNHYARTTATMGATTVNATLEAWFKISSNPASDTQLIGVSYGFGGNSDRPFHLFVRSTGHLSTWALGPNAVLTSDDPVDLDTWHHAAATLSGTTLTIWLDGVQVATQTFGYGGSVAFTGFGIMHGGESRSYADMASSGAVLVSQPAIFRTALSGTRIEAHYAAGAPAAPITLDLAAILPLAEAAFSVDVAEPPVGLSLDATLPTTEAAFSVDYTPPPVTLSLDATLPPLSVAFDVDTTHVNAQLDASLPLTQAAFDVTYTPPPVTLTLDATLPTLEVAFDVDTGGVEVSLAASLPMLVAAFEVTYGGPYPTDTANDANGRGRRGLATVTITRPVAAVPDTLTRATKVEKAIAYPAPTMDNGRPT